MRRLDLLNDNIDKLFVHYLVPSVLGAIAIAMYIFVDTMFIGLGVGSTGLAALNISLPVFAGNSSLALMLGIGGATTSSIFIGQGNKKESSKIFTLSIIISLIIGVTISVLGNIFSKEICLFLGSTEEILPLVDEYLSILISFSWAFLLSVVLGSFVRNDKDPKLVMTSTIIANLINVILDYVFIFIFHWRMRGAIIATVISPIVNILILCIHFRSDNNTLKFVKVRLDLKIILRIFKNGFATFVLEVCRGLLLFMFNRTLMSLGGEIYVSAYGIIVNVSYVGTCIFAGIAQSIQPIISVNFGAKRVKRIFESLRYAIVTSVSFATIFYLVILFFPKYIVALFIKGEKQLVEITIKGMRLYFLGYLFCACNIVTLYFLQSIEKSKQSSLISLSSGIVFSSLGLIILVPIFGILGVWFTIPFAEFITLLISINILLRAKKILSID